MFGSVAGSSGSFQGLSYRAEIYRKREAGGKSHTESNVIILLYMAPSFLTARLSDQMWMETEGRRQRTCGG